MTERPETTPELNRILSSWLSAEAPDREPEGLLDRVLDRTARTRRRPRWWRPGWSIDGPVLPGIRAARGVALMAAIALLALAIVTALVAGSRTTVPRPLGRPGLLSVGSGGELRLVDRSGNVHARASTGELLGAGRWSPDGARIAYADGKITDESLVIADADLHELLRIRVPIGTAQLFTWSPDGQRIAMWAETDTTAQVFVVDVQAGAVPVAITDVSLHAIAPVWSPDGAWIAMRGGVELDQQALYVSHPDGTVLRRLSQQGRAVGPPNCGSPWSVDSRTVFFDTGFNGIWSVGVDGSDEHEIIGSPDQPFCPTVAPDGKRFAEFGGQHQSFGLVAVVSLDGASMVTPDQPLFDDGPLIWSPDGALLAINTREANGRPAGVAILDPSGSRPAEPIPLSQGQFVSDWQRLAP
jgi:dipeptidyl aminopeptidase/acylaminoacyl peptidase